MTVENPTKIASIEGPLDFTYSLAWIETSDSFDSRFEKYTNSSNIESKVSFS